MNVRPCFAHQCGQSVCKRTHARVLTSDYKEGCAGARVHACFRLTARAIGTCNTCRDRDTRAPHCIVPVSANSTSEKRVPSQHEAGRCRVLLTEISSISAYRYDQIRAYGRLHTTMHTLPKDKQTCVYAWAWAYVCATSAGAHKHPHTHTQHYAHTCTHILTRTCIQHTRI